jgi:endo-1,4-beta-xylanase
VCGNLTSATRLVPGGYVVEAAIAFNTVRPAAGTLIGFDLAVNDATAGTRTAQTTWNDPTALAYLDTSAGRGPAGSWRLRHHVCCLSR